MGGGKAAALSAMLWGLLDAGGWPPPLPGEVPVGRPGPDRRRYTALAERLLAEDSGSVDR
jgi:hypothetical protein